MDYSTTNPETTMACRTALVIALGLGCIGIAEAQTIMPPEPIPVEDLRGFDSYLETQDLGVLGEPLTEAQLTRRLSRLYWYQSRIMRAQVDGDYRDAEHLLDEAMTEVNVLASQEGTVELARYKELFRTIVTEHGEYFGDDGNLEQEYGDVFELRTAMFDIQSRVANPTAKATELPEVEPVATVVPMTQNQLVEATIQWLLEERRDWVIRCMSRADTYFPMISQIFEEEGVPDELKYLAVPESALNPQARSSANAVGMWQFMAATGRGMGLTINEYVDERLDPVKATRAAARHMKELYDYYGRSWHVALAGYNCSPRCVRRAISRAGGTRQNPPSFWAIRPYLPKETRGYVPLFIASTLIMSNPTAYGLPANSTGPEFAYDEVRVNGMLTLETVAEMVGVTTQRIRELNPELRRNTLPPGTTPYTLRIPLNTFARFLDAFERLPDDKKRSQGIYTVRRGDTLSRIAKRHGVSLNTLMATNNLRRTTIYPNQRLVVPGGSSRGVATISSDGARSVLWGSRTVQPIQFNAVAADPPSNSPVTLARTSSSSRTSARSTSSNQSSGSTITHRVRRGETLSELADKYGTSVSSIRSLNGIRGSTIRVGQSLRIGATRGASVVHVVRRGENLTTIARRYGTTVTRIRSANGISGSRIYPGQRLTISRP